MENREFNEEMLENVLKCLALSQTSDDRAFYRHFSEALWIVLEGITIECEDNLSICHYDAVFRKVPAYQDYAFRWIISPDDPDVEDWICLLVRFTDNSRTEFKAADI